MRDSQLFILVHENVHVNEKELESRISNGATLSASHMLGTSPKKGMHIFGSPLGGAGARSATERVTP